MQQCKFSNFIALPLFLFIGIFGCSSPRGEATVNGQDEVKFQQYMVQGQQLYLQNCSNCHGEDGKGLARLYPPLAGSDFMLQNLPTSICGIKTGLEGKILVNNIDFNMKMPANPQLANIDIAEIATYIYNSWGNNYGLIPVKKVEDIISNCSNR